MHKRIVPQVRLLGDAFMIRLRVFCGAIVCRLRSVPLSSAARPFVVCSFLSTRTGLSSGVTVCSRVL